MATSLLSRLGGFTAGQEYLHCAAVVVFRREFQYHLS